MMHSKTFKIVGAILVALALIAFVLRGTFGAPPAPNVQPTTPGQAQEK